ncbi:hypothetical protein [Solimonas terrae]|uniref:Uncharacterized protein n=1 Tax=Solimonas terrae TaxID=1396819 RepID=A0A6M2BQS9_9GAMM|nr:hypothetical protein [Solimonas terrae]NGY04714.1 hypothetical protein [Solimonas terrae]
MPQTIITVHLPSHRRTTLKIEHDSAEASQAYDAQIGGYLAFLRTEGRKAGFSVESDERDWGPIFSIAETDHAAKKAAHDWLNTQPDFWNWIPSA